MMKLRHTLPVVLVAISGFAVSCSSAEPEDAAIAVVESPEAVWVPGPAGLSIPTGAQGPYELDPVPHEWEESPQGAAMAAVAAQVYMAGADDGTWTDVSRFMLEPGAGRDQWLQARALVTVDGVVDNPAQFTGFSVAEYDEEADKALIVLATTWSDGVSFAYPVQLSRTSGDWKVVLPTQDQAPDLTELSDQQLDDFIAFTSAEEKI